MKKEGLSSRVVLLINWIIGFIYFRILNRTVIHNKKGILKETGILFLSSHFTMVDSWLIGACLSPVDAVFRPWLIPHNVPEMTNFYKGTISRWWFDKSKCIPILRNKGGKETHPKIIQALTRSNVLIFPASTRSREDKPVRRSASLGKLIARGGAAKIIPIKLTGLPFKGGFFPILFKRIDVYIGEPVEPQVLGPSNTKEECIRIVDLIFRMIDELGPNPLPNQAKGLGT